MAANCEQPKLRQKVGLPRKLNLWSEESMTKAVALTLNIEAVGQW